MLDVNLSEILSGGLAADFCNKQDKAMFVYFLIKDNIVLYVGKAANVEKRVKNHKKGPYDRYSYIRVPAAEVDDIETNYIVKLNPRMNGMLTNSFVYARHTLIRKIVMDHISENFQSYIPSELVCYVTASKPGCSSPDTMYVHQDNVDEIAISLCSSIDISLPSAITDNSARLRGLIQQQVNKDKRKKA